MNEEITITHWFSDRLAAEADLTLLLKCLVTLSEVSEGGRWLKKSKNCPNSTKWKISNLFLCGCIEESDKSLVALLLFPENL